jgi:hypothetical protein
VSLKPNCLGAGDWVYGGTSKRGRGNSGAVLNNSIHLLCQRERSLCQKRNTSMDLVRAKHFHQFPRNDLTECENRRSVTHCLALVKDTQWINCFTVCGERGKSLVAIVVTMKPKRRLSKGW